MKRRRFVTLLAGAPIAGSAGYLSSTVTRANGSNDPAKTAKAAVDATPIPAIDIQSAALLVMDYQLAWIATLSDSDALLARAAQAIAIARSHGMQVAYCRVALTPADYAAIPDRNLIFTQLASKPGALDEDAPEMAIDDRVAPQPGDKVVRKTRVDAFARVDLDEWLRGSGIDTLILAGISTSGVVLSTVCDAADRDYRLLVLADACADTDPEIQDVLMTKVFPQRAQVITTADLPGLLLPSL
jgi:nicotinamidase-related amidase